MPWPIANPVLLKEMRSRMRGLRAFVILTVSLLIMATICALIYALIVFGDPYPDPDLGEAIGRVLFGALAIGETVLICVMTPSISAGAISEEEERKTLEILMVTPLRPHSILWGKLLSSMAYIGLLVLAVIPLGSLVLLFGGVSPGDMLLALVLMIVFMLAFACLGLFCSVAFRRTGRARGASLAMVALILGGTAFLAVTVGIIISMSSYSEPFWLLVPNPIVAMMDIVIPDMDLDLPLLPAWAYAIIGYLIWSAILYGGSLLLLGRRHSGQLETRRRLGPVLVIGGVILLSFFGFCLLPALLTWLVPL
ncbi:MAG: ABC transporter permease [Chloroflexia bacterium]|nr:ABC transporter permease [Chloroflexia bacterium]